jgi:predicted dithiol-disulfide oxidoreductase (DUF899 family)
MQVRFPGESAEYRTARDRLLEREIELRRAMEAVAAARRALPPGGAVPEDYVFEAAGPDGKAIQLRLSELFAPGKDSLVIYNFMFPRGYGGPRPAAGAAAGGHAQMAWEADDLKETIAELRKRGMIFEEYDVPGLETVNGIAQVEGNYPSK